MVHYSVLVCLRDASEALERLLGELEPTLDELVQPYEILCVDDASLPDEAALLEHLLDRHPALRLLRFDQPRGVSAALSAALAASRGDLLIAIEPHAADDVRYIPHLISWLSRHELVVAARERAIVAELWRLLAAWPRALARRATLQGDEDLLWAARREALARLTLARGAFRALPAIMARRGFRVCTLSLGAGRPPRCSEYRPRAVVRALAAWLDRSFEPHLASELARGEMPQPHLVRGAAATVRHVPRPGSLPVPPAVKQTPDAS